jgi:tetratricopeptide (TPR) repeat protein
MDIDNLDWGPDEVQVLIADADKAVAEQRFADAEGLLTRALELLETPGGSLDPDLANCLQKLSDVYCALDDFGKAAPIFERLLNLGEKMLGKHDPDMIVISYRLATAYELLGRTDEAGSMYARAVQNAEEGLGTGDPLTKRFRDGYAGWLERRARPTAGERIDFAQQAGYGGTDGFRKRDTFKATKELELELEAMPDESGATGPKSRATFKVRMLKHLGRWGHIIIPAICSLLLLVGASLWMQTLVKTSNSKGVKSDAEVYGRVGTAYSSLDKTVSISILNDNEVEVKINGASRKMPYVLITNGLLDARKVVEGFFVPREKWFQFVDDQLVGQDGGKLYAKTAVEWRVVDGMRRIVDFTQNYFKVKGTYPSNSDRWNAQPISKWVNPLTGRAEPIRLQAISLDVGLPYIFGSAETTKKALEFLGTGAAWVDETKADPCSIKCLTTFGTDKSVDGFKSRDFYIHGFDRNALVLPGPTAKTHFFVYLENGEDTMGLRAAAALKDQASGERSMPHRLYLVRMKSEGDPFLVKDAGYFLVGGLAAFCFFLWLFIDLPSRSKREGPKVRLLEILTLIFLLLIGIRYLLKMLP